MEAITFFFKKITIASGRGEHLGHLDSVGPFWRPYFLAYDAEYSASPVLAFQRFNLSNAHCNDDFFVYFCDASNERTEVGKIASLPAESMEAFAPHVQVLRKAVIVQFQVNLEPKLKALLISGAVPLIRAYFK